MPEDFDKYFTLGEAEQTRRQVEPLLVEAMEGRRKVGELQERLGQLELRKVEAELPGAIVATPLWRAVERSLLTASQQIP